MSFGLSLASLRELVFGGYEPGTWFHLSSAESGFAEHKGAERRPFILVAPCNRLHPVRKVKPRTTTGRSGLDHPRHQKCEYPSCCITQNGYILSEVKSVQADVICADNFSCVETSDLLVTSITIGGEE